MWLWPLLLGFSLHRSGWMRVRLQGCVQLIQCLFELMHGAAKHARAETTGVAKRTRQHPGLVGKHLAIDALSRLLPDRGRHVMAAVANGLAAFIAFGLSFSIASVFRARVGDDTSRDMK